MSERDFPSEPSPIFPEHLFEPRPQYADKDLLGLHQEFINKLASNNYIATEGDKDQIIGFMGDVYRSMTHPSADNDTFMLSELYLYWSSMAHSYFGLNLWPSESDSDELPKP